MFGQPGQFSSATRRLLRGLAVAVVLLSPPGDGAWARSSGGYQLPGSGSAGSASGGGGGYSSGGYSIRRPTAQSYGGGAFGSSGGDTQFSRGSSAQALRDYRAAQSPQTRVAPEPARRPSVWGGEPGLGSYGGAVQRRPSSGYASAGSQGSSVLNAAVLWGMLNALSSGGNARTFAQNQYDPEYQRWRAEANRTAARDPAVADKLARLDQQLAQNSPPPAAARAPAPAQSGGGFVWLVLFLLVGAFVLLWLWRRNRASSAAPGGPVVTGSAASRFRVGMTVPLDPAPFVLAQGVTKIVPPEAGGLISVEALGLVAAAAGALHRLYLPGRRAFFQLHLAADGTPDECRYFSLLDEVAPADAQEWGAWLDTRQGMIGWPEFQTKDGQAYARAWAPGTGRIAPQHATETLRDLKGETTRQLQLMLYTRQTGAAAPAPLVEHVLVAAVEAGGQAWVEIHVGIDVNPAALTLPAVPLS